VGSIPTWDSIPVAQRQSSGPSAIALFPGQQPSGLSGLEIEIVMGELKVKNGTPVGNAHLCRNCSNGQFTTGYRESEVMVICTYSSPARVVPFIVHECTEFQGRGRPDWEQMEKLAISLDAEFERKPTPGFRGSGFAAVAVVETEDEAELEEVART
jgi:hypothetical protein